MKLFILILCFLCAPGMLCAASLKISWNSNKESDLAGYRIYYGTASGNYSYVLKVSKITTVQVDGFLDGYTYFIALTAYDTSGNESGFSQEISIDIPEAQFGILDRIMSWITGLFEGGGSNPQLAQYSTADFSAMNRHEIAEALVVVQGSRSSSYQPVYTSENQPDSMIRDAVTQVGEPVDLALLYPDGAYFFLPITDNPSVIYEDKFYSWEPGAYLFTVYDSLGEFIHILRLSVLDVLNTSGGYSSGSETYLEDPDLGITLALSSQAFDGSFPIGIGWGQADASGSGSHMLSSDVIEFAIAPYGLVLSEPAEIRVVFDGPAASVEYYDESDMQWKVIPDVRVEDGMAVFSAQALGRFKVYSAQGAASQGDSSSGSNGACFISTCMGD